MPRSRWAPPAAPRATPTRRARPAPGATAGRGVLLAAVTAAAQEPPAPAPVPAPAAAVDSELRARVDELARALAATQTELAQLRHDVDDRVAFRVGRLRVSLFGFVQAD